MKDLWAPWYDSIDAAVEDARAIREVLSDYPDAVDSLVALDESLAHATSPDADPAVLVVLLTFAFHKANQHLRPACAGRLPEIPTLPRRADDRGDGDMAWSLPWQEQAQRPPDLRSPSGSCLRRTRSR